jgi:gluconokinase
MILLVMGVTGSGKTTAGMPLVQRWGWLFPEADDFHPAAKMEKMKHGVALCDENPEPWLAAIHAELLKCAAKNQYAVLACSALRKRKLG